MSSFFLFGFWQFLQAPSHIVVLLALGLLLGQQGGRKLRTALPAYLLAVTAGLLLTQVSTPVWKPEIALLLLVTVLGSLLAVRLDLPWWVLSLLAGVAGILIGVDSAPGLIPGIKAVKIHAALAGTAVGTSLAVFLLSLPALLLRLPLNGIVLRILGSWVVASALMELALMFSPRRLL